MRMRVAILIESHENHPVNREDACSRHLVTDFAPQRERGPSKRCCDNPELNHVSCAGGADEVNFGHVLGNDAGVSQLANRVNRRFFVNPREEPATKERSIGIEVLRLHPFPGVKAHLGGCIGGLFSCSRSHHIVRPVDRA